MKKKIYTELFLFQQKALIAHCDTLGISITTYLRRLICKDLGLEDIELTKRKRTGSPVKKEKKETEKDYFIVDPKKEAEWRRKRYQQPMFERPTVIF